METCLLDLGSMVEVVRVRQDGDMSRVLCFCLIHAVSVSESSVSAGVWGIEEDPQLDLDQILALPRSLWRRGRQPHAAHTDTHRQAGLVQDKCGH